MELPARDATVGINPAIERRGLWSAYLIETPDANLAQGMRQLNGVYTQRFNQARKRVGHVFQGRYKSILVEKGSYLLELSRYIVLNPVRARMVRAAQDWPWSSYRATAGFSEGKRSTNPASQ